MEKYPLTSIILYIVKKGKTGQNLQAVMGGNIRLLRGEKGLTIEKLAEKADLSEAYVAAIERGEKWLRPASIERIAAVLGVAATDLFNADNEIFYDVQKYAKKLVKDFETAVGKTVKKMTNAINEVKKS